MALLLRNQVRFYKHSHNAGFALPTILIASIVMLTVLLVSITSTTAVRTAISNQYHSKLAQVAGEAGVAYANSCLNNSNGVPQWSNSNPLMPNTDCMGNQLSGFTCPSNSVDARCSVMINGDSRSSFSVGMPDVDINGKSTTLHVTGTVSLLRTSNNAVWRSYAQSSYAKTAYPGIITSGLVLNLDAANTSSYPGSGTTWTDLSGNGNNVTLYNGVGYTANNGGVLNFDGISDYAAASTYNLSLTSSFSVSAWMKFNSYAYMHNLDTGTFNFKWRIAGNYPYWNTYNQAGSSLGGIAYTVIPTLNQWHYYTLNYDGANRSIYLDGALNNQVATTGVVRMPNLLQITSGSGEIMNGSISNVEIYNRALSTSEIQQNMNNLSGRYMIPRNVNIAPSFALWTLSGGASYNASTGVLTLPTTGTATSPAVRVDKPIGFAIGADFYATTVSPWPSFAPLGGYYFGMSYFGSDGTTPVYNSANYLGNGCAYSISLSVWTLADARCTWFAGGPNVQYAILEFYGTTYSSPDLIMKNPIIILR